MPERRLKLLVCDQLIPFGVRQLIQINDTDKSVRVDDHVCQKISKNIGICGGIIGVGDNIAVPADQLIVMVVKLADLEPSLQEVAGVSMVQGFLGTDRVPASDDHLAVLMENNIVFQIDTFLGDNSLAI